MAPPIATPPQFSRAWTFVPILFALYYVHLHGLHLQIYSLLQNAYTEYIVHLPIAGVLLVQQAELQTTSVSDSVIDGPRSFTRHIVAVGDLHGDYPNALRVLNFSGVVDESGDWSGNVDFLVQTGDIIDRISTWHSHKPSASISSGSSIATLLCDLEEHPLEEWHRGLLSGDDTIKLFAWMDKLRDQALSTGGTILSHLGNHEFMNAIGDYRYVYESEIKTFGSIEARQRVIANGSIGRSWASNYTVTSRLPLHPYLGPPNTPYPPVRSHSNGEQSPSHVGAPAAGPLSHAALSFVHGGLSPTYGALVPFPERINELGASLLRKLQKRKQPPPYPMNPIFPGLPESATDEERELYGSDGPLWYRGWAYEPDEKVCVDVEEVLKKTGTRRMIMGHTPDFHNIVARCNGKIIIIDTGISHAYGGVLSALSIHYTFTPIVDPGHTGANQRWKEREVVKALYADHQEIIADEQREVIGGFSVDT